MPGLHKRGKHESLQILFPSKKRSKPEENPRSLLRKCDSTGHAELDARSGSSSLHLHLCVKLVGPLLHALESPVSLSPE
jgi:hypothetical protein